MALYAVNMVFGNTAGAASEVGRLLTTGTANADTRTAAVANGYSPGLRWRARSSSAPGFTKHWSNAGDAHRPSAVKAAADTMLAASVSLSITTAAPLSTQITCASAVTVGITTAGALTTQIILAGGASVVMATTAALTIQIQLAGMVTLAITGTAALSTQITLTGNGILGIAGTAQLITAITCAADVALTMTVNAELAWLRGSTTGEITIVEGVVARVFLETTVSQEWLTAMAVTMKGDGRSPRLEIMLV